MGFANYLFGIGLAFWGVAFLKLAPPWALSEAPARAAAAFTFGFGVADLLWSVPFLVLGTVGLLRLRLWGWSGALAANVLYVYSLTVLVTRDVAIGALSPGTVLFLPFTLFGFGSTAYLLAHRRLFSVS